MVKKDCFVLNGVVEGHKNGIFIVRLENGKVIKAYPGGNIRKNCIRVLKNDNVQVEMSVYDLERGRIIYRHAK